MLKRKSKRFVSLLMVIAMTIGLFPTMSFADGGDETTANAATTIYVDANATGNGDNNTYTTLSAAVETANAGDIITISAGTYDIGSLQITKQVNLKGDGEVKLQGQIIYGNTDSFTTVSNGGSKSITVENIGFEAKEGSTNQALCFSTGVTGYTLNVTSCNFDGYEYGITANTGASDNTLNVNGVTFTDTGCAFSLKGGNTLGTADSVDLGSALAVQYFTSGEGAVNGYYTSVGSFKADQEDSSYTPDLTVTDTNKVVFNEKQLNEAINSASDATTITLGSDITLTNAVVLASNKNITINGNNHKISFNFDGGTGVKVAFTGQAASEVEGIPAGVTLNVNNVNFENTYDGQQGYAALIGGNSNGTSVSLNDCSFKNLYTAVYANQYTNGNGAPSVSITNCVYINTAYGYSFDEVTSGVIIVDNNVTFTGNTGVINETEDFSAQREALVTSNGVTKTYATFAVAMDAAGGGDTITLTKDITGPITIDKAVTVEGDNHTVNGGISVTVGGVTLNNVNATHSYGAALSVGQQGSSVTGNITVNGGTYISSDDNKQGEGAMRIFADGKVTVKNATTTGGIHVFSPGSYDITGNTIGFTYTGDIALVGLLIQYSSDVPANAQNAADSLLANNSISIPNISSFYVQIADGSWNNEGVVNGDSSVAKIGDAYYQNLQAAVDAVGNNGIITIVKDCDQEAVVDRTITFTIQVADDVSFTGTIKAADGYVVENKNGTYSVSRYQEPPYTGDYNYPVTVKDSDNGTVTIAKEDQWANDGEKITVTVTPDDAYMLDKLVITDKAGNELEFVDNGDGTYTFTMPKGAVTITATFVEDPNWEEPTEPEEPNEPALPFSDVHEGDWFYDVVKYVYDEGLMTGTSATTFEPNTTTTRGMIVSILHRLEGSPVVTGSDFTDVNDSDWYGQAVAWAAENGIVNGFEDSTFRPNAAITREQMAAILYNYADYKGYDVNSRANLDAYSDADQISSWASDVVAWANAEGLINGMTANTLEPQGNATRAQVAAIFQRFLAE